MLAGSEYNEWLETMDQYVMDFPESEYPGGYAEGITEWLKEHPLDRVVSMCSVTSVDQSVGATKITKHDWSCPPENWKFLTSIIVVFGKKDRWRQGAKPAHIQDNMGE